MKYLPAVQVMSAKSSVKNTGNITSHRTRKNKIKLYVHDSEQAVGSAMGSFSFAELGSFRSAAGIESSGWFQLKGLF